MSAERVVCVNAVSNQAFWQLPSEVEQRLRAHLPSGTSLVVARSLADLGEGVRRATVVLGWPFPAAMIRAASQLRAVHFFTAGIPESWQSVANVRVTTQRGSSSRSVAEHALFLTLAALRGARRSTFTSWAADDFDVPRAGERMSAAVFGFGGVGRALAALYVPLFASVTGVARHAPSDVPVGATFAPASEWQRVISSARVVALALPLTSESRALVGEAFFRALAPGTIVVNVASGALVEEAHVLSFVARDAGNRYATDVAHPEPYPDDGALLHSDRVLVTPHVAARREDAWALIEARALAVLDDALRGSP